MKKNKYTLDDLWRMQAYDLDKKIAITKTRIIDFYNNNRGRIYVAFSGGKDSTVLLDIVRKIYPDTLAVFVDTGMEYPENREFVKSKENVKILYPVDYSNETKKFERTNFKKVLEKYGYPVVSKEISGKVEQRRRDIKKGVNDNNLAKMFDGTFVDKNGDKSLFCLDNYKFLLDAPFKISNQCCHIMKRNISDMFSLRNHIFPLVATMADESYTRRVNWMQYGCDLGNKLKPISFWTEQDIFEYIVRYNLPYSECYGEIVKDENGKYYTTKCDRTGCMFCLYGIQLERNPNRMERMKETHPKMYDFCMKPVDSGGLGLKDVIDWMNENNTNNNRKKIRY